MLIPLQLRLCGLSAMAPALTETTSQASNFKPPYSPPARAQEPPGLLEEHDYQQLALDLRKEQRDEKGNHLFPLLTVKNVDVTITSNLLALLEKATASGTSSQFLRTYRCFSVQPPADEDSAGTVVDSRGADDASGDADSPIEYTMNSGGDDNNDDSKCEMGMLKANANLRFSPDNKTDESTVDLLPLKQRASMDAAAAFQFTQSAEALRDDASEVESQCHPNNLESVADSRLQNVQQRQINMERMTEGLLRRLRKLQMKQMEHHVTDQVTGLVAHHQKELHLPANREHYHKDYRRYGRPSDLKAEIFQRENVKNLSTAALVTLVRKLESSSSSSLRQKYMTLQHHIKPNDKLESGGSVTKLPADVCDEMDRVAGTLRMNLGYLKSSVDSDATDSSSGGESCDELDGYDEKKSHNVPICKRARWKWAIDRASIASRWTWLQAQVSDLEYRIRQQNELYRQLRVNKGPVTLCEPCGEDSSNLSTAHPSRLGCKENPSLVDMKSAVLERRGDIDLSSLLCSVEAKGLRLQNNGNRHHSQINGFVSSAPITGVHEEASVTDVNTNDKPTGSGETADDNNSSSIACEPSIRIVNDATCTASRTRPLGAFRKRKYLRTAGLYQVNKKAAKLSNIRCGCIPPFTPCTMCGGRVNNVHQVDPDITPVEERLGLLDGAYHPILSLDQDVALHLHFESLLKNGDWQKSTQKPKFSPSKKKSRITPTNSDHAHKHSRKLKKNATTTLTASEFPMFMEFKKKFGDEKRQKKRNSSVANNKGPVNFERIQKKHNLNQIPTAFKKRERSLSGSSGSSSKPESPVPSFHGADLVGTHLLGPHTGLDRDRRASMLQELMRKKRGESAFDINNIVIPYSMAASTRVERLQYKEILTPKWRLVEDIVEDEETKDKSTLDVQDSSTDIVEETIEDLSDEVMIVRHNKCEEEEKKKFMSYLHTNNTNRSRSRNVRTDSRADSSGANTPDPLSPFPMELQMEHQDSPLTTPPSTPAPLNVDENSNSGMRRRTTSLSKRDRPSEEMRAASPEIEEDPVAPWETRTFPISDVEMEEMRKVHQEMPSPSPCLLPNTEHVVDTPTVMQLEPGSQPLSPLSTSSTSIIGDDPNDPEWTVSPVGVEKGPRPGIVIKLAKR